MRPNANKERKRNLNPYLLGHVLKKNNAGYLQRATFRSQWLSIICYLSLSNPIGCSCLDSSPNRNAGTFQPVFLPSPQELIQRTHSFQSPRRCRDMENHAWEYFKSQVGKWHTSHIITFF